MSIKRTFAATILALICSSPVSAQQLNAPSVISETISEIGPTGSPAVIPASPAPAQLQQLERLAFDASPVIQRLSANVQALCGKQVQAGLRPNPKFGFYGDDMFDNGNGGRYGVVFGREIVRGNKLALSRNVVDAEIEAAQRQLDLAGQRLLTDVRRRYFDAVLAQRQVQLTSSLVERLQQIVDLSRALVEAQEAARTALLQSEIELEQATVRQRQAENIRQAAFGQLAALINQEQLPFDYLDGDIDQLPNLASIESTYDRLLANSPEINVLLANIETAKRVLQRACVEPIPNVTWQSGFAYDSASDNIVGQFQVTLPVPTTDRNQGAIQQAQSNIVVAQKALEQKVLQLRQRLVEEYRSYNQARIQAEAYAESIVPKSKETLDLVTAGYREGEVNFLQVLTAQRTYTETQLDYLSQVRQLQQQAILIEGQLLDGVLQQQ